MNETFDGSFKIYVDPKNPNMDDIEKGHGDSNPYAKEMFSKEVDNVKEDMKNVEKLYSRIQESNDEIKIAQNAKDMKELRAQLNTDMDHLLKLAKQINKKFDGLVRANAALRRVAESGPGSSDDQVRASMISEVGESLNHMMRRFQGLRGQMETDHRQLIESRYFAITREKATAESIDNLIASDTPESPLHLAMQEHGRAPVLDAVAEIQERRDAMRETRRSLMSLHQILLGIAAPVVAASAAPPEAQIGGSRGGGGGPLSPVEKPPAPLTAAHGGVVKAGTGGLNDYERETRKQAYIAIAVALVINFIVIVILLNNENSLEKGDETAG